MLRKGPTSIKKKMTMRQCIETDNAVKKVKERAEMFRKIDKMVLEELEQNINKSHLSTQEESIKKFKKIL